MKNAIICDRPKQNERKNHDYWLAFAPQIFSHVRLVMKFVKFIIGVFGVWTALLLNAPAQTNVITVTNELGIGVPMTVNANTKLRNISL